MEDWNELRNAHPHYMVNPDAIVVSDTVEINAPVSLVWQVLIDFPKYGDWNPFCPKAEATLGYRAPIHMQVKDYIHPGAFHEITEYICAVEENKRLSWSAPFYEEWPYAARRDQYLEETGPSSCSYHSTDEFLGETGIHVMRFAGPWVKLGFDETAYALKAHSEKLFRRQHQQNR